MNSHLFLAVMYDGVLIAVCGFALLRGGCPERIGAGVNLAASVATVVLRYFHIALGAPAELCVLTIDAGVLVCFFWLAVRTIRFWPIWAFGFALADVFVSLVGGLIPKTPLFAYHTGLGIYAYLALGALALGTYRLPRNAPPDHRQGFRPQSLLSDKAGDA